jgi:hypothetical protein
MIRSVGTLLSGVERLAGVTLEVDNAQSSAGVRVGARLVAHIDLQDGCVLVNAPADTIATLHRLFPSSRPTAHGIVFDLADSQDCSEALAAIQRRVHVERFSWQFRGASQ